MNHEDMSPWECLYVFSILTSCGFTQLFWDLDRKTWRFLHSLPPINFLSIVFSDLSPSPSKPSRLSWKIPSGLSSFTKILQLTILPKCSQYCCTVSWVTEAPMPASSSSFFGRDDGEVSCESKGIPGIPPNEKPPTPRTPRSKALIRDY